MAERKQFDWERIEREYRTNQFSDAELSRRHGCSRGAIQKRVKKFNWIRDLSNSVREIANARMVAEDAILAAEVAGVTIDEKNEIALASKTRVDLLLSHRKDIRVLRNLEMKLLAQLNDSPKLMKVFSYKGEIVDKEYDIAVTDMCIALNNMANVMNRRIQLERQAFNIDEDKVSNISEAFEDLRKFIDGTSKGPTGLGDDDSN